LTDSYCLPVRVRSSIACTASLSFANILSSFEFTIMERCHPQVTRDNAYSFFILGASPPDTTRDVCFARHFIDLLTASGVCTLVLESKTTIELRIKDRLKRLKIKTSDMTIDKYSISFETKSRS